MCGNVQTKMYTGINRIHNKAHFLSVYTNTKTVIIHSRKYVFFFLLVFCKSQVARTNNNWMVKSLLVEASSLSSSHLVVVCFANAHKMMKMLAMYTKLSYRVKHMHKNICTHLHSSSAKFLSTENDLYWKSGSSKRPTEMKKASRWKRRRRRCKMKINERQNEMAEEERRKKFALAELSKSTWVQMARNQNSYEKTKQLLLLQRLLLLLLLPLMMMMKQW